MTNDVIDLTGSALAIDNYVKQAYLNSNGELVLEMMDGTLHEVDLTTIPGGDQADNHVISGQIITSGANCEGQILRLTLVDGSVVDIDMNSLWEKGGTAWDGGASYRPGDIVSESDVCYIAIASSIGKTPSASPLYWVECTASYIEKGGTLYMENVVYNHGDVVIFNDTLYYCKNETSGIFNPSDWEIAIGSSGSERGGIAWDATSYYTIDDIVALGQVIYIANTDNTGKNPASSSEWTALSLAEKGGLSYNSTQTYSTGDIVSESGAVYVAIASVPAGNPPPNSTYWATPSVSELGGREWASGNTYQAGDIVTDTSDNNIYLALTTTTGSQPSTTPSEWKAAGANEVGGKLYNGAYDYVIGDIATHLGSTFRCINNTTGTFVDSDWINIEEEFGGREWDSTISYSIGDVVTSNNVFPVKAYVSLKNGNEGNTPIDQPSQYWQEFDSVFYNVGTHHPTSASDEYPDYSSEEEGGIWYISGLGEDMETGMPNTYTYVNGDLAGIDVIDGDRIIWISTDEVSGEPHWLWIPMPRISAEKGGVEWMSRCDYHVGDIVTYNEELYVALTDHSESQPDINPTDWKKARERGGVAWNSTSEYMKGDIVVDLTDFATYKCNIDNNIGNQPSTPSSGWDRAIPDERGGIAWVADRDYRIGDIVTEAGIGYYCNVNHTSSNTTQPSNGTSEWTDAYIVSNVDPGTY